MDKQDTWDYIIILFIALISVSFSYAVFKGASGYEHTTIYKQRDAIGREIPQCGKELWLRIKDGCSNDS